jgi:branched-chain amino acid transport system permease protein
MRASPTPRLPATGPLLRKLGGAGLALVALAPVVVGLPDHLLYLATMATLLALLAQSWNLPAQAGLISFGHAAFFGVGAYASALLSQRGHTSPWLGLLGAAAAAAIAGWLVARIAGDLPGVVFSLVTLTLCEALRVISLHWTGLTEGAWGLVGIPGLPWPAVIGAESSRSARTLDYCAAAFLLGILCTVVAWIRRRPFGLALEAIRQGEGRAEALGVDTRRVKASVLALSAVFAGLAGGLYAHLFRWLDPTSVFGIHLSVMPLIMAMFGGTGTLLGPVVGAAILYLGNELGFQRLAPGAHLWLYGAAIVLVIVALPQGIIGWVGGWLRARMERGHGLV